MLRPRHGWLLAVTPATLACTEPSRSVENFELISVGGVVFVVFDVYATNPVALLLEVGDEVAADEATGTGD